MGACCLGGVRESAVALAVLVVSGEGDVDELEENESWPSGISDRGQYLNL